MNLQIINDTISTSQLNLSTLNTTNNSVLSEETITIDDTSGLEYTISNTKDITNLVYNSTNDKVGFLTRISGDIYGTNSVNSMVADSSGLFAVGSINGGISSTIFYNTPGNVVGYTYPSSYYTSTATPPVNTAYNTGYLCNYNGNGNIVSVYKVLGTLAGNPSASLSYNGISTSNTDLYAFGTITSTVATDTPNINIYNNDGTLNSSVSSVKVGILATNAFLVKYSKSTGVAQWLTKFGGDGSANGNCGGLSCSYYNNSVYVLGYCPTSTANSFVIYDGPNGNTPSSLGTITNISPPTNWGTVYLSKFTDTGITQWCARIYANNITGYKVVTNSSGIYLLITFNTATGENVSYFDAGNYTSTATGIIFSGSASVSNRDMLLIKFNLSGIYQWRSHVTGSGTEFPTSSENVLSITSDSIYVSARSGSTDFKVYDSAVLTNPVSAKYSSNFDPGNNFVIKYDLNGLVQWVSRLKTGTSTAGNTGTTSPSIYADDTGVYSLNIKQGGSGQFQAIIVSDGVLDPVVATTRNVPILTGNNATFLIKYDTSGIFQKTACINNLGNTSCCITGNTTGIYCGIPVPAVTSETYKVAVHTGNNYENKSIQLNYVNYSSFVPTTYIVKFLKNLEVTSINVKLQGDNLTSPVRKTINYTSTNNSPLKLISSTGNTIGCAFSGTISSINTNTSNSNIELLYNKNNTPNWSIRNFIGFNPENLM